MIFHVKEICDSVNVEHPTIISESGRAMVAYHSVLVFNILGWSGFTRLDLPQSLTKAERKQLPAPVVNLFDTFQGVNDTNYMEYYHDAQIAKDAVLNLFSLGYCTLEQRSLAERLFFGISGKILNINRETQRLTVEGLRLVKRHVKKGRDRANPEGGILEKSGTIALASVALVCPKCDAATRVGVRVEADKKKRFCKKCEATID